jgi:hypothetical protein
MEFKTGDIVETVGRSNSWVHGTLAKVMDGNVTTIDEALDYNPDYSVVEVRDVFDYPLSRPIVPNQG